MRWSAKYVQPKPIEGDSRLYRRFAWCPVYIDGNIIWLETYEILQVYRIIEQKIKIDSEEITFLPGNWINLAKRCK